MVRRGQDVVEIIRMVRSSGVSGNSGILPLSTGTRQLPVADTDSGFDFWGPGGYGVIEDEARYRVSYAISDGGIDWVVSVFVEPNTGSTGNKYLGSVGGKAVRYAARVRK
jgi:hypothetical protein